LRRRVSSQAEGLLREPLLAKTWGKTAGRSRCRRRSAPTA